MERLRGKTLRSPFYHSTVHCAIGKMVHCHQCCVMFEAILYYVVTTSRYSLPDAVDRCSNLAYTFFHDPSTKSST
jgi:hypothetical protein